MLDNKAVEQIKGIMPELFSLRNHNPDPKIKANNTQATQPQSNQQAPTQVVTEKPDQALQKQIHTDVLNMLRRVLPVVQSPSEAIQQLDKAFNVNKIQDPILKPQVEQLIKQIKDSIPQGKTSDPESIKQMFTSPTLNLSPVGLTSAQSQQGMMGGLVALLQIALASRVVRQQSGLGERLSQFVAQLTSGKPASFTPATARTQTDIGQLDPRGQALRELAKFFASHQANKLANAEQALQGQDSFYYALPSAFGHAARDIEMLIRREPEKQGEKEKRSPKNSTWHLTMKLSVGEKGEMLSKARLTQDELEIDFYTSNDDVKILILEYLPMLKKRFSQLGIQLGKTECQLGKIPRTLQNKPYGIFEARA